jgi:HEAT repeat protein
MTMVESREPSWEECMELLDHLPGLGAAARGPALARLLRNSSPGIRERALRLGAVTLGDEALVEMLRDDADAVRRNAGLEILKLRGARSYPVAIRLLRDPEPDVVLQAVLLLDHLRDPRALAPLRAALAGPDPNVQQAVILAIGRLGNASSVPDLLPFLGADPWLQMAAVQALGDLRSVRAVRPLANLFTDLVVGPLAVEAVARIGGALALRALAAHWLCYGEQLDAAAMAGLLAHVLEGLRRVPADLPAALAPALAARLGDPQAEVRQAAARALLAIGPSPADAAAVGALADLGETGDPALGSGAPPPALARRGDLVAELLARPGLARAWGITLCARPGAVIPAAPLLAAVRAAAATPELLPACVQALSRLRHPGTGAALLDLYLALPPEARDVLAPLARRRRDELRAALAARGDLDAVDRLVLGARLGAPPAEVTPELLALAPARRVAAVTQLAGLRPLMRALPWEEWLRADPALYGPAAAEAASRAQLHELLPALRALRPAAATPALLRAFGDLADRAAVPVLLAIGEARPELRPPVHEALGRIGGPEARAALRAATRQARGTEGRAAWRALAQCAAEEDEALFRAAVTDADWHVRLMCAEVLGRFGRPENLNALARLAGDPVPAVAGRALALLEG